MTTPNAIPEESKPLAVAPPAERKAKDDLRVRIANTGMARIRANLSESLKDKIEGFCEIADPVDLFLLDEILLVWEGCVIPGVGLAKPALVYSFVELLHYDETPTTQEPAGKAA